MPGGKVRHHIPAVLVAVLWSLAAGAVLLVALGAVRQPGPAAADRCDGHAADAVR